MEKFLFGFDDNGGNFFDGKRINTMNTMASALVFLKDKKDKKDKILIMCGESPTRGGRKSLIYRPVAPSGAIISEWQSGTGVPLRCTPAYNLVAPSGAFFRTIIIICCLCCLSCLLMRLRCGG